MRKPINGSRIHLFGMAYKPNVGDVRESPALDILELLTRQGADGQLHGSAHRRVARARRRNAAFLVGRRTRVAQGADCYVVCTNHDVFDYDNIVKRASLIVDTRNALRR